MCCPSAGGGSSGSTGTSDSLTGLPGTRTDAAPAGISTSICRAASCGSREHLVDRAHASARDAGGGEPLEQLVDARGHEHLLDALVERVAVREAIAVGRKARVVLEVLEPDGPAEPRPQARIGDRDDDLAVGGRIRLVGRERGMRVAQAARAPARGRDDARRQAEDGHRGVEQRDVDELALPGARRG